MSLFSDPAYPGLECAPFVVAHASGQDSSVFDNGLSSGPVSWVSLGTLSALHSSRYSAGLAGLPVTPAVDNLVLSGGALLARAPRAVRAGPLEPRRWRT